MANYYRRQNSILSFVAMAVLSYFVGLPLIIAILMEYFGSVDEIIVNVVGLIPFGQQYYELAIQFINFLSGVCRISVSYLAILMILIGWKEGIFFVLSGGVLALLALGIVLGGIEMILESAFD